MGTPNKPTRPDGPAWWVGLSREAMAQEVTKRLPKMQASKEATQVNQSGGLVGKSVTRWA